VAGHGTLNQSNNGCLVNYPPGISQARFSFQMIAQDAETQRNGARLCLKDQPQQLRLQPSLSIIRTHPLLT